MGISLINLDLDYTPRKRKPLVIGQMNVVAVQCGPAFQTNAAEWPDEDTLLLTAHNVEVLHLSKT